MTLAVEHDVKQQINLNLMWVASSKFGQYVICIIWPIRHLHYLDNMSFGYLCFDLYLSKYRKWIISPQGLWWACIHFFKCSHQITEIKFLSICYTCISKIKTLEYLILTTWRVSRIVASLLWLYQGKLSSFIILIELEAISCTLWTHSCKH